MYVGREGGVGLEGRHRYVNTYLAANELASDGGLLLRIFGCRRDYGLAGVVEELWTANSDARDPNPAQT